MNLQITPLMIACTFLIGIISAYISWKRGKNPYLWFAIGFMFGLVGFFAVFFLEKNKKPAKELPKEPVFTIQGPTNKFWYYLDPSHQQNGPLSKDALTAAWKEGKVNLSTFIWHEELSEWKPFKEILKLEI